jgi:signal transduction histidine kinase
MIDIKHRSVVIVDDDIGTLKLLGEIIRGEEFKVRQFSDGFLALRSIEAELPETILLDMRMPVIDGLEICKRLKKNENTKNIPVIFITGAEDIESKCQAFEAGGEDYIIKPFQKEDVIARVRVHTRLCYTIEKLKQTEAELTRYKNHLEDEVLQRTHELKAVNQSLIIAKEAAEKANIAKSTFIATMSHELRTPLNAILGFSELMGLDKSATVKQKETLDIINRSGAHLLNMINDVLDISKIEAGRLALDVQALNVVDFLNDICAMINVRAEMKQLDFRLEIASNMTQFIKTDRGKLRQVLINLLGNAIKFTATGSVVLRASTLLSGGGITLLIIEVIDSGVGIPADKQSELFQPFVQVMQANSAIEGVGLGLTISKSLIQLMGGQISVNSEFGVGSTFKIELPVELTDVANVVIEGNSNVVKHLAPNQPTWRLLIVDDKPDNRLLLATLLTDIGFQVREVENGRDAIHEFKLWKPHLIWMDMLMPVMDGYEATAAIRQLKGGDKVKIIALTASVFKEQHQHILDSGCNAVLHKPFHISEIFTVLVKHLGVKFIYDDTLTPSTPTVTKITNEMLRQLPVDVLQKLHAAALLLDIEEIDMVIESIRVIEPEIADALDNLAKKFQFEQISKLTDSIGSGFIPN